MKEKSLWRTTRNKRNHVCLGKSLHYKYLKPERLLRDYMYVLFLHPSQGVYYCLSSYMVAFLLPLPYCGAVFHRPTISTCQSSPFLHQQHSCGHTYSNKAIKSHWRRQLLPNHHGYPAAVFPCHKQTHLYFPLPSKARNPELICGGKTRKFVNT